MAKGANYTPESEYEIALNNLRNGYNERAYLKKVIEIYDKLSSKFSEKEQGEFYLEREEKNLLYTETATKEAIFEFDNKIGPLCAKYFRRAKRSRYIDFNQGVDARLVTDAKMKKLSEVAIRPLRIAFDHYSMKDVYIKAIRIAVNNGITDLSNYLLYNYEDKPEELYYRMKINVEFVKN